MGNTMTTNVKRKDERSDGKKKALLRKRRELKKYFMEGGKENSKTLPDCHERDKNISSKITRLSRSFVLVLKHTQYI